MLFYLLSLPSPPLLLILLLLFPFSASSLCQFRRDNLNLLKIIFSEQSLESFRHILLDVNLAWGEGEAGGFLLWCSGTVLDQC